MRAGRSSLTENERKFGGVNVAVSSSVARAVFGEQPSFQDVSKTVLSICLIVRSASHEISHKLAKRLPLTICSKR